MNLTCHHCGAAMRVAGAYHRKAGSRKMDNAPIPPSGLYEWGHITCHQCGHTTDIAADSIHVDKK